MRNTFRILQAGQPGYLMISLSSPASAHVRAITRYWHGCMWLAPRSHKRCTGAGTMQKLAANSRVVKDNVCQACRASESLLPGTQSRRNTCSKHSIRVTECEMR